MKTEIKEIYKCDHCRKVYQIKRYAIAHEPKCKKNPINTMRCFDGCIHLIKKEVVYYFDGYDGEHEGKKEILFCEAKKEGVYPFWLNNPLLAEDMDSEIPNEVMPKECDLFKFLI